MKVIIFNSLEEGQAFERIVWTAKVKKLLSRGYVAKNSDNELVYDVSNKSDAEIADLKICGEIEGLLRTDNGTTTAYAIVEKAYNIEKYYMPKPETGLIDLSGYEIIDLPIEWLPPEWLPPL